MIDVDNKIHRAIVQRANKLQFGKVYEILDGRPFILAGGSLCGDPVHDYDVYPCAARPYTMADVMERVTSLAGKDPTVSLMSITKNAVTVMLREGQTVQFCSYLKPTLKELVDSFDFSHVQVGIWFAGAKEPPVQDNVYYTDAFVAANVTRQTEYTGSEYPTASIVRMLKYYKRGKMTRAAAGRMVMEALAEVVKRGFADYGDFKDQMDAIDLGLSECAGARTLYVACDKAGLVKSESDNQKGNNQ